ncbi:unnamed protein product [Phytophthora fragariaefolia]|uniref:Unnamed protein product n=1 Tax=Phytophthora fragariaefolia TaxID=1490495 RepID=A0A9W6XKD9_9STRA|nr:unnamed protein product [Phytophthora fragariaefolia]
MTPKISRALGFQEQLEQLHQNPSILAGGGDFFDDEEWNEVRVAPRRRSSSVEAALNSCVTSLSSGLHLARSALATHANRMCTRDSNRRGSQLRNSMEVSSSRVLARANSMPTPQHRSSESDLDLFGELEDDEPDAENAVEVYLPKPPPSPSAPTPAPSTFARLLPVRSWTQGKSATL